MSDEINQLISQAKSEARDEKIKNFFRKNKKLIKNSVVIALSAVLLFLVITITQNIRQKKFSEILHQSLVDQQLGNIEAAKENLKKIHEATLVPSGVKSLASMRYAAFLLNDGKVADAVKIYHEVNSCRFCDKYVQDLAGLLVVKIWMADEAEIKKDDLAARIEKIENASKPLKYHVAEQRAILEMKKNNLEKSYQIFEMITQGDDVFPALKERAKDGLRMVTSKGFEPKVVAVKAEEDELEKDHVVKNSSEK